MISKNNKYYFEDDIPVVFLTKFGLKISVGYQ